MPHNGPDSPGRTVVAPACRERWGFDWVPVTHLLPVPHSGFGHGVQAAELGETDVGYAQTRGQDPGRL